MARRTIIVNFLLLIALYLHGSVFAGTVQNASLLPGEAHISPGATAQLNFSAINDHTVDLKSYSIVFHYSAGLSISNLATTPAATTVKIDTRKNTISLLWSNVPVGSELHASFEASSVTVADYDITPDASKYVDVEKKRFSGTCSTSHLQIRPEFVPPSAPSLLRSQSGDNAIHLSWVPPSDQDLDGYRIYRRTSDSSYNPSTYSSIAAGQTSYVDSGVSADPIYSYVVSAVDNYGNESELSNETTSMTINGTAQLLSRIVHGYSVDSAIGDFMGDGQADIIASNGASVTFYKNGIDGRKTTIPIISPDAAAGLNGNFGNKIMAADLNNDGIDDLIVSDPLYDLDPGNTCTRNTGKVYIYAGGADFSGAPILTISGTAAYYYDGSATLCQGEELGRSLASAGDVNADGYQDVVIGVPYGGGNWSGEVAVLLGGPDFSSGVQYAAGAQPRDRMGYNVASAGDVNNDGKADIVAGTSSTLIPTPNGKAYLIWGGDMLQPAGIALSDGSASYGQKVGGMDINNDGYSDILVSSNSGTAIHLGSAQPHPTPDRIAVPSFLPLVDGFGDFNQDGHADLLTEGGNVSWGDTQTLTAPSDLGDLQIYDVKDFNTDGIKDILAYDGNETISVYSLAPWKNLPEIHISSPGTNGVTPYPTEQITGSIRGEISMLSVGGQDVPVVADGSFEYLWRLTEGENALEVIAVTPDNKIAKVNLTLTYTVPPPLTLTIDYPMTEPRLTKARFRSAGL